MLNRYSIFSFLFIVSMVAPADAVPVRWDVSNVQYQDDYGDIFNMQGSFSYDADEKRYFDFNIRSALALWNSSRYFQSGNSDGFTMNRFGRRGYFFYELIMEFNFKTPLTNAGGENRVVAPYEILGFQRTISDDYDLRDGNLIGGTIVGTEFQVPAVPLPSGFPLLFTGLSALFWFRSRQESRSVSVG